MNTEQIFTADNIDPATAKAYFETEKDIDYLPEVPEKLTALDAAVLLSVSEPTISRMVKDGQIKLTRTSILAYIKQNFKYLKPLNLTQNTPNRPEKTHKKHQFLL